MVTLKELPPNFKKIKEVLDPPDSACYTYGSIIYNPSGNSLSPDLIIHEEVHEKQQKDPEDWWNRYLTDSDFRLEQELEAYATQYLFIKGQKDSKMAKRYLEFFAHCLSTIYKLEIDFYKAFTKIKIRSREISKYIYFK